jgi:hypothetical protein
MPYRYRKNGKQGQAAPPISQRIPRKGLQQQSAKEREPALLAEQRSASRALMQFVLAHPGVCLGSALAMGVFVGWLIKRK